MAKGEGPYHGNPHKDGPDGGNKIKPASGVSVSQGKELGEGKGQTNQGYAGKVG